MKAAAPMLVCTGGPKPARFDYYTEHLMSAEISNWLNKTFKGGYGVGYFWANGKIWFKRERDQTMFILRWS